MNCFIIVFKTQRKTKVMNENYLNRKVGVSMAHLVICHIWRNR